LRAGYRHDSRPARGPARGRGPAGRRRRGERELAQAIAAHRPELVAAHQAARAEAPADLHAALAAAQAHVDELGAAERRRAERLARREELDLSRDAGDRIRDRRARAALRAFDHGRQASG
jgi:hypothetical protein